MRIGIVAVVLATLTGAAFADIIKVEFSGAVDSPFNVGGATDISGVLIYDTTSTGTSLSSGHGLAYDLVSFEVGINGTSYLSDASGSIRIFQWLGGTSSAPPTDERLQATANILGPIVGPNEVTGVALFMRYRGPLAGSAFPGGLVLPKTRADFAPFFGSGGSAKLLLAYTVTDSNGVPKDYLNSSVALKFDTFFVTPVPEPGTYVLFGLATLGYGIYRGIDRRRKSA